MREKLNAFYVFRKCLDPKHDFCNVKMSRYIVQRMIKFKPTG